jgi:hypothetical protein
MKDTEKRLINAVSAIIENEGMRYLFYYYAPDMEKECLIR